MSAPDAVDDLARRWLTAWNVHDAGGVAALCTEDVVLTDPTPGTVHGRPGVAGWVHACIRAFPDMRFEQLEPPFTGPDGTRLALRWRMSGTHTGLLDPPGFAATGKAFEIDGVDFWTVRDGLVADCRAEYDSMGLAAQLGLMPARGSRVEKAMTGLQRAGMRVRTEVERRRKPG
ncbi:MAG: DUF4440 domain-containing protein [Pseudonocardiaceae bacterium]|nr:MAG: DUF4440 domain-containing protein [Pseudonocardiaceae bacterium]